MRRKVFGTLGLFALAALTLVPCASAQAVNDLLASALPASGHTFGADSSASTPASTQLLERPTIIVGFLGGFVSHTDRAHGPVQFAERLHAIYPSGVRIEVFENHKLDDAEKTVVGFTQSTREGKLNGREGSEPRVILYGHSWGASAAVSLARKLQRDGVPVTLTVQIDSIPSFGRDDSLIPTNVAHAVNFYQRSGLLRGEPTIKAADPKRTEILGNFRFDYDKHPVTCKGYPWWNHVFSKTHMEIECDPQIWNRVESYVRSEVDSAPVRPGGGQ
jgi:pimeloyl-ACP methyl ester carboxylesterase